MIYVSTDESGRVTGVTDREEFAGGMAEVGEPEGFDWSRFGDWLLADGALTYDGAQTAAEEAARREAEAEAERRATIEAGAAEYFADGGKQAMEQSIRDAASSGGTDPQLKAAVPMLLSAVAESMDDDELASVALALPEWEPGVKRKRGAACRHGGVAYRVVANVSKNNDAEPGTPEGADYYAPVDVGPSGVQAWEPDKSYMKGERVEHGGRVWESLKNNNREEPGTGKRWAEVADGAD